MRYAAVLLLCLVGCAVKAPPAVMWHRRAPAGWTAPERFAGCTWQWERVLADDGRRVVQVDCPDRMAFVDTASKRVIWEGKL